MKALELSLFPISFGGALVGVLGMIGAPDALTADVAALLFLGCAIIFSALIVWCPYPGRTDP